MGKREYRTYPPEFKQEVLELIKNSGKSAGQIERDLGITPGLLGKWQAKYQAMEKRGKGGKKWSKIRKNRPFETIFGQAV